jgi:Tfp pilus assembly protein PilX
MINKSIKKQEGAALAVGLILLLIITLMGYTSMKGTMLQEKMAAGLHNRSLASSGANSAVRLGEEFLYNLVEQTNGVDVRGTPGGDFNLLYSQLQDPNNPASGFNTTVEAFKLRNWTSSNGTVHKHDFTNSTYKSGSLNKSPYYIIEEIAATSNGSVNSQEWGTKGSSDTNEQKAFLITGKSQSGDGKTTVLSQSMYTVVVSSSPSN